MICGQLFIFCKKWPCPDNRTGSYLQLANILFLDLIFVFSLYGKCSHSYQKDCNGNSITSVACWGSCIFILLFLCRLGLWLYVVIVIGLNIGGYAIELIDIFFKLCKIIEV